MRTGLAVTQKPLLATSCFFVKSTQQPELLAAVVAFVWPLGMIVLQVLWQQYRLNGNLDGVAPNGEILLCNNTICTLHHIIHSLYLTVSFAQQGLIAVINTNGSLVFLGNWVGTVLSFH